MDEGFQKMQGQSLLEKVEDALKEGRNRSADLLLEVIPPSTNPSGRAKLTFHRARLHRRRGNNQQAARYYQEAANLAPGDPLIRSGAITAHVLIGDVEGAEALAKKLFDDFPDTSVALSHALDYGLVTKTAREAATECLAKCDDCDLRMALALRAARELNWECATEHAEAATRMWGDRYQSWLVLSQVRLDQLRSETKDDPEAPPSAEELAAVVRLKSAASTAIELLRSREDEEETLARALTLRGIACRWGGDETQARTDFAEAFQVASSFEAARLNHAQCLFEAGNFRQCIDLLEDWEGEDAGSAEFTLGHALLQAGETQDVERAVSLLSPLVSSDGFNLKHEALALCLAGLRELGRSQEARGVVESASGLPEASIKIALAWTEHEVEGAEKVRALALEAFASLQAGIPRAYRRRLALLLAAIEEHSSALELWTGLFQQDHREESLRSLVHSAMKLGAHQSALDAYSTYRKMHAEGVPHDLVYHEAWLRMRPDPDGALALLADLVRRCPNDRLARLRMSTLAHQLGRPELVVATINELPSPEEISPEEGRSVALLVLNVGQFDEAISYAYRLYRAHHGSGAAHAVLRDTVLMSPEDRRSILDPTESVTLESAVKYREEGDDTESWIVLQEDPIKILDEHDPQSKLGQALLGRGVGQEFVLTTGFGVERRARITEIRSKYLFRFHQVMEAQGRRFPEDDSLVVFKLPKKDDGSLDFNTLLSTFERQRERSEKLLELYREQPVPLTAFANGCVCEPADAMFKLLDYRGVGPRVCIGTQDEREGALSALGTGRPIVADIPALLSVFLSGNWKLLEIPGLVVGKNCLTALEKWNEQGTGRFPNMHALCEGPAWAQNPEGLREQLRMFLRALRRHCETKAASTIASMNPEDREQLDSLLGEEAVEALALARQENAILWTDDLVAGIVASEKFEVSRVWTQAVCFWAQDNGRLTAKEGASASAHLVGWNYRFTSLGVEAVAQAGDMADWDPTRWPFRGVLEYLGSRDVKPGDACVLSVHALRYGATRVPLPNRRKELTLAVAESLTGRKNGLQAVIEVRRRLKSSYGLGYIAEREVVDILTAWIAGSQTRIML